MSNVLQDTDGNLTFDQYAVSDFWVGGIDADGYPTLVADVPTLSGVPYHLTFSMAANLASNQSDVAIEVSFADQVVGTFEHSGALYAEQEISFTGTGSTETLSFRIIDNTSSGDLTIDTSGVIPSYAKTVIFGDQSFDVDAFVPGQSLLYQVLNGQLVKFDLETQSYQEAEIPSVFNINAIGYNTDLDVIMGHARQSGTDSLGVSVANGDIVMIDARGATYKIASTPYAHYIGDFDDQGNLWTFPGNLWYGVRYDLSAIDETGAPAITVVDLPPIGVPTGGLADLAYHPDTKSFYGIAHGGADGANGHIVRIDVSALDVGGEPTVTTVPVVSVLVDGELRSGMPKTAFGATMVDGDGNIYVGANNANHDLDDATPKTGGFYAMQFDTDSQAYTMELLSEATPVGSNDGAMDTRGLDPFLGIDASATVLLRAPELTIAIAEDDEVLLTSGGDARSINLLANDETTAAGGVEITHINGQAAALGLSLTLPSGGTATLGQGGLLTAQGAATLTTVTETLTYRIEDANGVADEGVVRIVTSPVDGTGGNDHMMANFRDADGNMIEGADGEGEVILGYAGDDKIFSHRGRDIIYGGSGADFIRAHEGDDAIYGESGNDVLDGGVGADTMIGGAGNDVYYIDDLEDIVSEGEGGDGHDLVKTAHSHVLADVMEDLWLIEGTGATEGTGNAGANFIRGNELANTLIGLAGADTIIGLGGDDSINGGEAADQMHGGDGHDTISGEGGDDKLHGGAGGDLFFGGAGADTLCPGLGDDTIYGGDGDDLLSGGAGADEMHGGDGDDRYIVTDVEDLIFENANNGHDRVHSTVSFTLPDNFEILRLSGQGDMNATGNDLNNRLIGNRQGNEINGLGGVDRINGRGGKDTLSGGDGRDKLNGGNGRDELYGGDGNDKLRGAGGQDVLDGGRGDDKIFGGGAGDTLIFRAGDGHDTVKGFSRVADEVLLFGVSSDDVSFIARNGGVEMSFSTDSVFFAGVGDGIIDYLLS
ncbi:MAG: calcium-binding protein [Paracoccaceae bacterium]|nr:calcium-binding protein [Paracoccaceae bacterium]